MVVISRAEINRMEHNILDNETGMTEFDLFEFNHCYENIDVVE